MEASRLWLLGCPVFTLPTSPPLSLISLFTPNMHYPDTSFFLLSLLHFNHSFIPITRITSFSPPSPHLHHMFLPLTSPLPSFGANLISFPFPSVVLHHPIYSPFFPLSPLCCPVTPPTPSHQPSLPTLSLLRGG